MEILTQGTMAKGYKLRSYNPLPQASGKIQLLDLGFASARIVFCMQPSEVGYNYYLLYQFICVVPIVYNGTFIQCQVVERAP